MPIAVKRKHGSVIEDVDGNLLIDMLTGWGATNVGATHPEVMAAAIDALRDYGQEIPDYISAPLVVELAEKLVEIAPDPLARVTYEISGTEAVLKWAAKKGKQVLLASTSEVYGKSTQLPFREDADLVLGPSYIGRWSYACSKLLDELVDIVASVRGRVLRMLVCQGIPISFSE